MEDFPYDVIELVAAGRRCDLLLATRTADRRPVIVKQLRPGHLTNPDAMENLLSEADLLPLLDHPNVVRRVEVGFREGVPYLVLEHVAGVDMRDLLLRCTEVGRTIDVSLATFLAQELLKALAHVHSAVSQAGEPLGLVHRDVNPANVLLGFDGRVLLTDFGIAVAAELERRRTLDVEGKLAYLAPEQVMGDPVDHRVDIYAAGVVLYELTTLSSPFAALSEQEEQATLQAISSGRFRSPGKVVRGYDRKLEKLVQRAMARRPTKRFERAEHMAVELSGFRPRGFDGRATIAALLPELFPDRYARASELYSRLGRSLSSA